MLKILRRIKRRLRPAPVYTIEAVELRHLDGEIGELVRRRLIEGVPVGIPDGDRSIRLPHPQKPGFDVKIKGAGVKGRQVLFGKRHHTGPTAPLFDFEGRMMEDVASGHDNAYHGGASFQQAATEYHMAELLAGKGYRVMPCIGYGRVRHKGLESWFSVHECQSDWLAISPDNVSLEDYIASKVEMGRLLLELAVRHGIVGYASAVGAPGQPHVLKDLHPFRRADPLSMSQLSWVMQLFFALHLVALAALHFTRRRYPGTDVSAAQVAAFRALHPEVTLDEHEALRRQLVAPYMLRPPAEFDPIALKQVLDGNPITRAMLEACPPEYARY